MLRIFLHLLSSHLRFLECCYLQLGNIISSSSSSCVFRWSCSLSVLCLVYPSAAMSFVSCYTFVFRLCSGIMCVQSTIVPLSRAGKHTICESALCLSWKKRQQPTKCLCMGVVFMLKMYQLEHDEQLFSRSTAGKKKNLFVIVLFSFSGLWYIGKMFYLWAAWVIVRLFTLSGNSI